MKSNRPPTWSSPYPPHGQGIFTFNVLRRTPFEITVRSESRHHSNSADCITLAVQKDSVQFLHQQSDKKELLAENTGDGVGLNPDEVTSYWFSFDRDNLMVKYGKGYFMEETTLLSHSFLTGVEVREHDKKRGAMKSLFGPQVTKVIEFHDLFSKPNLHILQVKYHKAAGSVNGGESKLSGKTTNNIPEAEEVKVEFFPQPLIVNRPFAVNDSSTATLFELDRNEFTFTASLPPECQELYTNISSANISLNWTAKDQDSRYKFSDAIRYSLETEGKILNTKLQSKRMKYIRVTVGPSHATSPGIPYVLELWPHNEGSPVHSHGNTYGIIKVLHGGVRVEIFNRDMKTLIKHFDVREGDVTWMSPHWYQSHRLFNDTADFCATLQCYRYGLTDQRRWPYFDYVCEDGSLGEFFPNSDFTFSELHRALMEEYSTHMLNSGGKE